MVTASTPNPKAQNKQIQLQNKQIQTQTKLTTTINNNKQLKTKNHKAQRNHHAKPCSQYAITTRPNLP